ncbi:Uncharacterized protein NEOC65_000806 [Neochlamydia sp. AcF65]|nr:Uncharacterized protein [Neochlamydia sp. AcF65]MBS4171122.1 Uncharacterized protein [Neochlamydia sp. AcF95]
MAANIIRAFSPKRSAAEARQNATYTLDYLRKLLGKVFVK